MPSPPLSIVQSLSPRVAVLASDDVADSCAANGCHGLDELLRPWEGGTERVSILSTTLTPTVHPTFSLRFVNYASVYANPQLASPDPDMVVDLIGSCVGRNQPEDEQQYPVTRALLLASRPLAPHETFNHPVGVLFAVSTSTPDPLPTLTRLYGQAVGQGAQAAPWMDGVQVLKFFVVVHDVSKMGPDLQPAHELLAAVKKTYGPHSTLLVLNSRQEVPPLPSPDLTVHSTLPTPAADSAADPPALSQLYASTMTSLTLAPVAATAVELNRDGSKPGKRYASKLTPEDVNNLIALVREIVVQSLVPWMEARVREWNEAYQSNKRGITGRLFGAGRKLFGNSRPTSPSPTTGNAGYNSLKGYYPVNSIEALARRLADVSFMLRDYKYAAGVYDGLRRDYAQDRAWRYQAAATEMYGLSQLLAHNYFLPSSPPSTKPYTFTNLQHTDISSWLEQAVATYQSRIPAKEVQLDALRITVLYYEAWKVLNEWRGVNVALVRAAGEAEEVPCGVLLEEAAAADLKGNKGHRGSRRQALHLTMAARRYEKAGLKTFSRRCLVRASNIIRDRPWKAAQDRIEHSLGRQAYTLGESGVAVEHFLRILHDEDTGVPASHGMVLDDLALAYEQLANNPEQLAAAKDHIQLATPLFDKSKTRIILPVESSANGSADGWAALEQRMLANWDRKGKKPMTVLPDTKRIVAAIGEAFLVELTVSNPINAPIVLEKLTVGIEPAEGVEVETIDELSLEQYETRQITVAVTPKAGGAFTVASASCMFHAFLPVSESLERRGRRLQNTKQQRLTPTYAIDTSLTVHTEASSPRVAMELFGVPHVLYEGEVVDAIIHVNNPGTQPVENVQLAVSRGGVIAIKPSEAPTAVSNTIPRNLPITLFAGTVAPGATESIEITFTAPAPGPLELLALAVFSGPDGEGVGAARLSHDVDIKKLFTIAAEANPTRKGYTASVEITSHADGPLELTALRPIAQYWETTGAETTPAMLYPNQSFRAAFPLTPSGAKLDLDQTALVANLGRVLRGELDHLAPIEPASVSISLPDTDGHYLTSRAAHRRRFAAQYFGALQTELVPRVIPMFEPLDLDFAVTWRDGDRRGHAALHGLTVAPRHSLVEGLRREVESSTAASKRTMYEETARRSRALVDSVLGGVYASEEEPLFVRASIPTARAGRVTHDFTADSKSSLVLPVELVLQNRSPARAARWIVRLPPPTAPSSQPTRELPAPLYTGSLAHRGVLAPGASVSVDMGLWVGGAGLVGMGGWEIECETGDGGDDDWEPRAAWANAAPLTALEVVQSRSVTAS